MQLASIELVAWSKSNYLVKCFGTRLNPNSRQTCELDRLNFHFFIYHYSCGLTDTLRFVYRYSCGLASQTRPDRPNFHISLIANCAPTGLASQRSTGKPGLRVLSSFEPDQLIALASINPNFIYHYGLVT
jgi:hypothetical protein